MKTRAEQPQIRAEDVSRAIHDALGRHADREANRVHVEASDGFVTLTGSVQTWDEKKVAIGAARGLPGVRSVIDQLRIEP